MRSFREFVGDVWIVSSLMIYFVCDVFLKLLAVFQQLEDKSKIWLMKTPTVIYLEKKRQTQ